MQSCYKSIRSLVLKHTGLKTEETATVGQEKGLLCEQDWKNLNFPTHVSVTQALLQSPSCFLKKAVMGKVREHPGNCQVYEHTMMHSREAGGGDGTRGEV